MIVARGLLLPCLLLIAACATPMKRNGSGVSEGEAGFEAGTFYQLDMLLDRAGRSGDIPGGALVLRRDGNLVYTNSFGRLYDEREAPPVGPETLFDVASLTKPLAGVPVGILLLQRNGGDAAEAELILRLLNHSSGMNDENDYQWVSEAARRIGLSRQNSEQGAKADVSGVRTRAMERLRARSPVYMYSNTGYVILSLLASQSLSDPAAEIAESFWKPLGVASFTFHPDGGKAIAASGYTAGENRQIGRPFDPLADEMVSLHQMTPLHSGLFATASDVALFADSLQSRALEDDRLKALRRFLIGQPLHLAAVGEPPRSLYVTMGGLESPTSIPYAPDASSAGRIVYQTGYTGCMLWIDTRSKTSLALLTNASLNEDQKAWKELSRRAVGITLRGLGGR